MASETEWFSIMPESKRREEGAWEMTKMGNADHIQLIHLALLLQPAPEQTQLLLQR